MIFLDSIDIDKIRDLFYSNNITLALQLIEGLGLDLKEVLLKLCVIKGNSWVLVDNFDCFKTIEIYVNCSQVNYILWLRDVSVYHKSIEDCIEVLKQYLIKHY